MKYAYAVIALTALLITSVPPLAMAASVYVMPSCDGGPSGFPCSAVTVPYGSADENFGTPFMIVTLWTPGQPEGNANGVFVFSHWTCDATPCYATITNPNRAQTYATVTSYGQTLTAHWVWAPSGGGCPYTRGPKVNIC